MKTANKNNYNVGIYCRLSKDDNNNEDESSSISNQKDMLIRHAQREGWNLTRIYQDDGFSGTNFQRPDFKSMIQDIKNGVINLVLCKDVSRLGRNYAETGYYTDTFFPENGVRFVAVNDAIDTITENDIIPFKHVLNEMYAKDISRKTRSARKTLAENGKFATSKPSYGYMKSPEDRHKLIIDEAVADNVRRIFEMFLSGKSGRHIAEVFNSEGIPSPSVYYYLAMKKPVPKENQWGSGTVLGIIKNPVYKGDLVSSKRSNVSFKNKRMVKNPANMWVVVENAHEAIISKTTWESAQKKASKNHVGIRRGGNGEVALFSGIAKCMDCGANMTFNRKSSGEYYRCGRYTNKGTTACKPHTIIESSIYTAVINDIRAYAKIAYEDEQLLIDRLANDSAKHNAQSSQRHEKLIKEKEHRLVEIDTLIQSLFEDKFNGTVPENIFKRMAKKYDDEQQALADELEKLKDELVGIKRSESDITSWIAKIRQCLSIEALTREIIVELIDSIEISNVYEANGIPQQNINIIYRFENLTDSLCNTSSVPRAKTDGTDKTDKEKRVG